MKYSVTKTLSIEVTVLNNITIIDNYVYLNKHIEKLGINLKALDYDSLTEFYNHCPELSVYDVNYKELFSNLYLHDRYDGKMLMLGNKPFSIIDTISLIREKHKLTEKYFIKLDETISEKGLEFTKLYYFNTCSHTLWKVKDDGMFESSQIPFKFDYMNFGFDDEHYELKDVLKYLKDKKDLLFDEFLISDIHNIPYYNRTEGRSSQLSGIFLFKDSLYKEYSKLIINKQNRYDEPAKLFGVLGVSAEILDIEQIDILGKFLKIDKFKS